MYAMAGSWRELSTSLVFRDRDRTVKDIFISQKQIELAICCKSAFSYF